MNMTIGNDKKDRVAGASLRGLRESSFIALATIVVVLVAVEMWLRVAPPAQWSYEYLVGGGPTAARLVQPHPYLAYTLTPSFRKDGVHHNALGYRGGEIAGKTPETTRIICIGGSSTYGVGASSDAMTWPAQLQTNLSSAHPDASIDVINAGVPGYTSFESLIDFELRGLDLSPDIVLVYQGFNDLRAATRQIDHVVGDNTHYRQRWTAPGDALNAALSHSRVMLLSRWLFTDFRSRASDLSEYVVVRSHAPQFVRPASSVAQASYRRNVVAIVGVARAAGARVLLITQAYGEATIAEDEAEVVDAGMSSFAQVARDVVEQRNDPSTAVFDARRILPQYEGVFSEIDHLSDRGSRVLGALLADQLTALGWIPTRAEKGRR